MLVPGDDPPFVAVCLVDSEAEVRLRTREARELIRRLEEDGRHGDLVARIFAARRGRFPQRFDASPADEQALLAALGDGSQLGRGLTELLAALRDREETQRPAG